MYLYYLVDNPTPQNHFMNTRLAQLFVVVCVVSYVVDKCKFNI